MGKEIVVLVTASTRDEAEKIAQELVDEKLAACVNVLGDVVSIFRWQGNVSKENEFLMIIKSVSEQLDALIKRVKQLHSYQVPEIIALPIIGGSEDYLSWMQDQTTPHTES